MKAKMIAGHELMPGKTVFSRSAGFKLRFPNSFPESRQLSFVDWRSRRSRFLCDSSIFLCKLGYDVTAISRNPTRNLPPPGRGIRRMGACAQAWRSLKKEGRFQAKELGSVLLILIQFLCEEK